MQAARQGWGGPVGRGTVERVGRRGRLGVPTSAYYAFAAREETGLRRRDVSIMIRISTCTGPLLQRPVLKPVPALLPVRVITP